MSFFGVRLSKGLFFYIFPFSYLDEGLEEEEVFEDDAMFVVLLADVESVGDVEVCSVLVDACVVVVDDSVVEVEDSVVDVAIVVVVLVVPELGC